MRLVARRLAVLTLYAAGVLAAASSARAADPPPAGQITYAGTITPYMIFAAVGPRVDEPALALIPYVPYSAPYEEFRLKP
jgi:ABC-type phosphate transport system substrate-binding protein